MLRLIKKKIPLSITHLCLNIYPKEMGGVKFERMTNVDSKADLWFREKDGKYYYLNIWDGKGLVPYYPLPEVVGVSADYVARMLSCPYTKLKALKVGAWEQLQAWIPVVVLVSGILFLIIMGG